MAGLATRSGVYAGPLPDWAAGVRDVTFPPAQPTGGGPPFELREQVAPPQQGPGDASFFPYQAGGQATFGVTGPAAQETAQWPLNLSGTLTQIARALDVLMTHQEQHWQENDFVVAVPANTPAGTEFLSYQALPFYARALVVDNPTAYNWFVPAANTFIPAQCTSYVVRLRPAVNALRFLVQSGTQASAGAIYVRATEEPLTPTSVALVGSAVVAGSVTISGQPIEVKTLAGDIAAGSAVAGAFVDGAITSIGFTTDAAQTGANGSVIAQLKGLFNRIIAAGDAVAGAIGMLTPGLFDGTNTSRWRAVGTGGAGLGTGVVAPPNGAATQVVSAANTAVTLTLAAVAGQRNHLKTIDWSFLGGNPAGTYEVDVADNVTTVARLFYQPGALPVQHLAYGESGFANAAVNTTLAVSAPALGAGIQGVIGVTYWVG